ncbi:MAG: IPExxxVDY family protein [Bacteroidetes bacterium]|nr:IPExxxVDY family protein [Bacteroidota bacterium]
MAKKIMLESRAEASFFTLAGVSCHLKDYRLSFLLNQNLHTGFRKMDDLTGNLSLYFYLDEECRNSYYLICNRSEEKVLFPELKQTDFVMLVEGPFKKTQLDRLLKTIRAIPNVLTAFEIQVSSLKNFSGFLADLELHLMKIKIESKTYKPTVTKK